MAPRCVATRNAVRLTHERFRADAQGLIGALQRALKSAEDTHAAEALAAADRQRAEEAGRVASERWAEAEARRQVEAARLPRRTTLLIATGVTVVLLAIAGVFVYSDHQPPRPPATDIVVSTPPPPSVAVTPSAATGPLPLSAERERALKPRDTFRECANCPEMMVAPAGSFMMGSPDSEPQRASNEGPQHTVTIAGQFAVGRFALTFDEWDGCVADGGCNAYTPGDQGWGRGRRPVINVSWKDAKAYIGWLATKSSKSYRLLTEAEYEYAVRAGTQTAYPWGNDIGSNNANCDGCGSQWDKKQTAPVGSFASNGFGLYDMVGNVWEWTEDCHGSYVGAPSDGSAATGGECIPRALRGGSWYVGPRYLRSAARGGFSASGRSYDVGFRVARTLLAP
jgi:formylglycine-generating enzyme required for sulfatase activity